MSSKDFGLSDLKYFKEFKDNMTGYALEGLEYFEWDENWEPSEEGTILSEREIITLSWIATTKDEAERILKRNNGLLEDVYRYSANNAEELEKRDVGCPHCYRERTRRNFISGRLDVCDSGTPGPFVCSPCAWRVLHDPKKGSSNVFCRDQTFGGYELSDVFLRYSDNCEWLEAVDTDLVDTNLVEERRNRNSVFLGGHVEWALMLKCGDIAPVDRPFRTWSITEQFDWIDRAKGQIAQGKRRG